MDRRRPLPQPNTTLPATQAGSLERSILTAYLMDRRRALRQELSGVERQLNNLGVRLAERVQPTIQTEDER